MILVDAHEDLAWNAFTFGRDYSQPLQALRARENGTEIPTLNRGPVLLGWDAWLRGRVGVVFASLFAAPRRKQVGPWDVVCYDTPDEAHRLCRTQLDYYHRLVDLHPDKFRVVTTAGELEALLAGWHGDPPAAPRLGLVLALEGADAVRQPHELPDWHARGVRVVGPAWAATRYAGGTTEPGPLTPLGHALLEAMADLGMLLDLSHMSDEGVLEALERYPGGLVASHANARARLPHSPVPERHLSDAALRRLAEREGVVGIVPYNRFLKSDWQYPDPRGQVTLDDLAAHIDYVCQVIGDVAHVGLGSDFDGGFGMASTPVGLDSVGDLGLIGEALRARGYRPPEIEAILGGNWLRVLRRHLPES